MDPAAMIKKATFFILKTFFNRTIKATTVCFQMDRMLSYAIQQYSSKLTKFSYNKSSTMKCGSDSDCLTGWLNNPQKITLH